MTTSGPIFAAIACAAACSTPPPPTCAADDLDCFMDQFAYIGDSSPVHATLIDTDALVALRAATSSSASVPFLTGGPASLSYPDGTLIDGADVIDTNLFNANFTDPNGCRPVVGFTLTSHGVRSKHTGCFPGLHDMKKSGTITAFVGFTATAAAPATFGVELTPISSTDCTSIDAPATLITTPGAVANLPVSIPVMISPPPAGGGGGPQTCPDGTPGLLVSTLDCDPLGNSGTGSYCLTAAEFMTVTMMPLPAACYPSGTTGCEGASGALVKPCCPNLTCKVSQSCGENTNTPGGICL